MSRSSEISRSIASLNNGIVSESVLLSIQEVEERIQQLLTENSDLRNTLQQNNIYMRQLGVTLIEWQDEVVRAQTIYQNKFERAKDLITKLKQENAELKSRIHPEMTSSVCCADIHTPTENLPTTLPMALVNDDQAQEEFESLGSYVLIPGSCNESSQRTHTSVAEDNAQSSKDSLYHAPDDDKKESNSILQQLQKEVSMLRIQLANEMDSNKNKQILLNQTQNQLDRLLVDYQDLSKKWGQTTQMVHAESADDVEVQELKQSKMQLTERCSELEEQLATANARLATAEEIALCKQIHNTELQRDIAQLEKSLDTMEIFKAQMEVYQADFEAERDARQTLAGEKEALAQEVRQLKRQLDNAVGGGASINRLSGPQESTATTYACPKCDFAYTTVESLNNHLDDCLNQQMFP